MTTTIGIRREDKNRWERRVPLTPAHVARLVSNGLEVVVQPSSIRVFPDAAYRDAGARVEEDLTRCRVVFAVKEIPIDHLLPDRTYVFFAHVIKGQSYNMPLLRRLLEQRCTLIDYERITDSSNRRLVLFGRHAGLAGMLDALWALGQRFAAEGHDTAFAGLKPTHEYRDLESAKQAVKEVGRWLAREGLPAGLAPLTVGVTGYGHTSQGAQEILDLLPHTAVSPEELARFDTSDRRRVFKIVFHEKHMVEPLDASRSFALQDYYDHPEHYRSIFSRYVPKLSVLMNCIYWEARYPRLVTKELLHDLALAPTPLGLRVIGDVSCDVNGAIECTVRSTSPDGPVYVYRPKTDDTVSGVAGDGPVVLAVDNLPCELPLDASSDFGDALIPFVQAIAAADYGLSHHALALPPPIQRAVVTHHGALTPGYAYLSKHLESQGALQ